MTDAKTQKKQDPYQKWKEQVRNRIWKVKERVGKANVWTKQMVHLMRRIGKTRWDKLPKDKLLRRLDLISYALEIAKEWQTGSGQGDAPLPADGERDAMLNRLTELRDNLLKCLEKFTTDTTTADAQGISHELNSAMVRQGRVGGESSIPPDKDKGTGKDAGAGLMEGPGDPDPGHKDTNSNKPPTLERTHKRKQPKPRPIFNRDSLQGEEYDPRKLQSRMLESSTSKSTKLPTRGEENIGGRGMDTIGVDSLMRMGTQPVADERGVSPLVGSTVGQKRPRNASVEDTVPPPAKRAATSDVEVVPVIGPQSGHASTQEVCLERQHQAHAGNSSASQARSTGSLVTTTGSESVKLQRCRNEKEESNSNAKYEDGARGESEGKPRMFSHPCTPCREKGIMCMKQPESQKRAVACMSCVKAKRKCDAHDGEPPKRTVKKKAETEENPEKVMEREAEVTSSPIWCQKGILGTPITGGTGRPPSAAASIRPGAGSSSSSSKFSTRRKASRAPEVELRLEDLWGILAQILEEVNVVKMEVRNRAETNALLLGKVLRILTED